VDWVLGAEFAILTVIGGMIIIFAFILLSYASWKEIQENKLTDIDA